MYRHSVLRCSLEKEDSYNDLEAVFHSRENDRRVEVPSGAGANLVWPVKARQKSATPVRRLAGTADRRLQQKYSVVNQFEFKDGSLGDGLFVMVRTKRCHLSFQFLGVVHDDTTLIIGESTVLMGKTNQLFGHANELFHF
jgi:hypothetical protein